MKEIEEWISKGVNIDICHEYGYTPLGLAVKFKKLTMVKFLLDHGANVHLNNSFSSLIHLGASNGCVEIMRLLLERGANINAKDGNGDTLLHYALLMTILK